MKYLTFFNEKITFFPETVTRQENNPPPPSRTVRKCVSGRRWVVEWMFGWDVMEGGREGGRWSID
jgi:hypothetical protein